MVDIRTNSDDIVIIFYHNDQDGALSCSLIKNYYNSLGVKIYLFPVDYSKHFDLNYFIHNINNSLKKNDQCKNPKVFMVDYTCVDFKLLVDNCKFNEISFVWIDHHISNIEKYKSILDVCGIRSIEKSGCYLTYKFLYPNSQKTPKIVDIIDQFDRNQINSIYNKSTQLSVINYLDSFDVDLNKSDGLYQQYIKCLINDNYIDDVIIPNGLIINKYLKQQAKNNLSNVIKTSINNIPCLLLNTTQHGSWLFEDYEDNDKYVLVVWYCDNQNNYRYSFYSDNNSDVDCSKIASCFGGGGHKHAAGCTTKYQIFNI